MRNLKLLICLVGNNVENLNRTFATLNFRYGVKNFDIAGIIGDAKLSFQGRAVRNISLEDVPTVSFDYIIAAGGAVHDDSILPALRSGLAEKINVPRDSIIFDFEIYGGRYTFPKVCLVVIFNHRFDRNLPLLRKIYGDRFSDVKFLMPFYDGADADVIPVYESSVQFQGYFIQAFERLKNVACSHYLFIGDDLIIAPDFDEMNFVARTNMSGKKFLDTPFISLNTPNRFRWYWTAGSSKPFYDAATSWKDSIYTYDEAMTKFNNFFGEYKEFYEQDFFGNPNEPGSTILGAWNTPQGFLNVANYFIMTNRGLKIPYPMASGYSDIFCVDKGSLFEFSRLCGIFSAMNMFVEIAIPTAAVLTFKRDDVQFFPGDATSLLQGKGPTNSAMVLWGNERALFENKYGKDFNRLCNEWPKKIIYVHPVKLSGWKIT